jgi:hypothetical protein
MTLRSFLTHTNPSLKHSRIAMKTIPIVCLFIALVLCAEPVLAQRKANTPLTKQIEQRRVVRVSNNTTTTSISGNSSSQYLTLSGGPHHVLVALSFAERTDDPCYVRAVFKTAQHGHVESTIVDTEDTLCASTSNDWQGLGTGNTPALLEAIHAIRVGMNRKGNKIKAVTTYGSTIDQDESGEVRRDPGMTDSFERPNFREPWKDKVSCGSGEVAAGVVLHYHEKSRNPSVEGIALECADVTVREFAYRAGTDERVPNLRQRND